MFNILFDDAFSFCTNLWSHEEIKNFGISHVAMTDDD